MSEKEVKILAIESSCDETAAAVVVMEGMSAVMSYHPRLHCIRSMEV